MEPFTSPDLLTEKDLGSLLTPTQYSNLLRNTSPEDSFLGAQIKVAATLSATEERDCLLSTPDQNIRGIISIATAGSKRRKTDDEDSTGASHGGQLTFRPAEDPLIATSSFDYKTEQVKSIALLSSMR